LLLPAEAGCGVEPLLGVDAARGHAGIGVGHLDLFELDLEAEGEIGTHDAALVWAKGAGGRRRREGAAGIGALARHRSGRPRRAWKILGKAVWVRKGRDPRDALRLDQPVLEDLEETLRASLAWGERA
jgi:hypothetical protein